MVILDKFLSLMKLNDEDEYENDIFDDDDDEEFDEPPKNKPFVRKRKKDYDDEDVFEEKKTKFSSSKVTPIRQAGRRGANMEVSVVNPTTLDEVEDIVDSYLKGCTIILNFEGTDIEISQRIIDIVIGAKLAVNGKYKEITKAIHLFAPANVEITGEFIDGIEGYFKGSAGTYSKTRY